MSMIELFQKYNLSLTEKQNEMFDKYYQMLIETNKKFNLTAITEKKDVEIKHFLDSVLPVSCFSENSLIVDVGSGAGFPAIPLKIMREDLKITMIDSLNKRVNFLNEVISSLNFSNTYAVHSRAEDFAKENREKFDYAIARAVAPLNTLLEYLLPLVKVGGSCIIYKSVKLEEEINNSSQALSILGGEIKGVLQFQLEDTERKILIVEKKQKTPFKYPRSKNLPKTQPII